MTALWITSALLTVVAVVVFAWWIRKVHETAPDSHAARLAVFRDRRAELDAELDAGRLEMEEHMQAIAELEELAAQELVGTDAPTSSERWPFGTTIGLVVVIPLIAFAMYLALGGHQDMQRAAMPSPTDSDLSRLVDQLAARMAATPDDLQGWMLLGRSSLVLGEYARAVDAWRQAQRLAPDDPTVLANLAEALAVVDEAALDGEAGVLVEQALVGDPTNPKALWYGGIIAERRGDQALARDRWSELLRQDPPEEFRRLIDERLGVTQPVGEALIEARITVAAGESVAGTFLFLAVYDPEAEAGPPLAAVRRAVERFPMVVTLDATDAMLPGTDLGAFPRLRVVARLSRDGGVERRPGDLYGESDWAAADGPQLELVLDRRVE